MTARMVHCTRLYHDDRCLRDGTYCSMEPTHDGPCQPHGIRQGAIHARCGLIHWTPCAAHHRHDILGCPDDGLDCFPPTDEAHR